MLTNKPDVSATSGVNLRDFELAARRQMWRSRPQNITVGPRYVFLMSAIFPPFLIIMAMFVPLIGLLVVGLGVTCAVSYLLLERTPSHFLAVLGGLFCSWSVVMLIQLITSGRHEGFWYVAIGTAPFFSMFFLVLSGMALWGVLREKAASGGVAFEDPEVV